MSPLLRGGTEVDTKKGRLKLVRDFVQQVEVERRKAKAKTSKKSKGKTTEQKQEQEKFEVPKEDKSKFSSAYDAQISGDLSQAKKIYDELLKKYKGNSAIEFNLAKIKK